MSEIKIHTWFPKSLYIVEDLHLSDLDIYENKIKEIFNYSSTKSNGMLSVSSSHKTNDQLHLDPTFEKLVNSIYEHSYKFLNLLGYSDSFIDSVDIKNMWANISVSGDFIFPHIHSDSILSGAFYIKKYEGSKIKFFNDITSMYPKPEKFNELNYEYCDYDCNPGRLILFKSDFLHGTEKQPTGEKIVISFNIGKQ